MLGFLLVERVILVIEKTAVKACPPFGQPLAGQKGVDVWFFQDGLKD